MFLRLWILRSESCFMKCVLPRVVHSYCLRIFPSLFINALQSRQTEVGIIFLRSSREIPFRQMPYIDWRAIHKRTSIQSMLSWKLRLLNSCLRVLFGRWNHIVLCSRTSRSWTMPLSQKGWSAQKFRWMATVEYGPYWPCTTMTRSWVFGHQRQSKHAKHSGNPWQRVGRKRLSFPCGRTFLWTVLRSWMACTAHRRSQSRKSPLQKRDRSKSPSLLT